VSESGGLRTPRPSPLIVAIATVTAMLTLNMLSFFVTASTLPSIVGMVVAALLLVGLMRGHRLAWQWGRYLAPFTGLFLLGVAVAGIGGRTAGGIIAGALFLLLGVLLIAFPFLLSRPSVVEYVRLTCPKCGARTKKAADFLFNHAKCGACPAVW
jgi:hypothetical protein